MRRELQSALAVSTLGRGIAALFDIRRSSNHVPLVSNYAIGHKGPGSRVQQHNLRLRLRSASFMGPRNHESPTARDRLAAENGRAPGSASGAEFTAVGEPSTVLIDVTGRSRSGEPAVAIHGGNGQPLPKEAPGFAACWQVSSARGDGRRGHRA